MCNFFHIGFNNAVQLISSHLMLITVIMILLFFEQRMLFVKLMRSRQSKSAVYAWGDF